MIAVIMAASLCACSGQAADNKDKETQAAQETAAQETTVQEAAEAGTAASQIANPMTEYASLEEINEIAGGKLAAPADKEVTDEKFWIIDAGDYKIAQYDFTIDKIPYCYRFADGVVVDISGVYEGEGTLFEDNDHFDEQFKNYDGGKAGRYFTDGGQYVLIAEDEGKLDFVDFQNMGIELFNIASESESESDEESAASPFDGSWYEEIAGRASMNVFVDGDQAQFDVNWANSAAEVYVWEFTGTINDEGVVEYKDGVKYSLLFDEDGNGERTDLSDTNSGTVSLLEDGKLLWIDNESENPEGTVFVHD